MVLALREGAARALGTRVFPTQFPGEETVLFPPAEPVDIWRVALKTPGPLDSHRWNEVETFVRGTQLDPSFLVKIGVSKSDLHKLFYGVQLKKLPNFNELIPSRVAEYPAGGERHVRFQAWQGRAEAIDKLRSKHELVVYEGQPPADLHFNPTLVVEKVSEDVLRPVSEFSGSGLNKFCICPGQEMPSIGGLWRAISWGCLIFGFDIRGAYPTWPMWLGHVRWSGMNLPGNSFEQEEEWRRTGAAAHIAAAYIFLPQGLMAASAEHIERLEIILAALFRVMVYKPESMACVGDLRGYPLEDQSGPFHAMLCCTGMLTYSAAQASFYMKPGTVFKKGNSFSPRQGPLG